MEIAGFRKPMGASPTDSTKCVSFNAAFGLARVAFFLAEEFQYTRSLDSEQNYAGAPVNP